MRSIYLPANSGTSQRILLMFTFSAWENRKFCTNCHLPRLPLPLPQEGNAPLMCCYWFCIRSWLSARPPSAEKKSLWFAAAWERSTSGWLFQGFLLLPPHHPIPLLSIRFPRSCSQSFVFFNSRVLSVCLSFSHPTHAPGSGILLTPHTGLALRSSALYASRATESTKTKFLPLSSFLPSWDSLGWCHSSLPAFGSSWGFCHLNGMSLWPACLDLGPSTFPLLS